MKKGKYYTKSELKANGWTDAMIKRFLPEPDRTYPNPRYKNAAPVRLYQEERIEKVKETEDFRTFELKSAAKKESAKKAVETKRRKVVEWVNSLTIEIPEFEKEDLIVKACEHFNQNKIYQKECYDEWASRHYEEACENEVNGLSPDFSLATPSSDESFIARITTNYLRHQCTKYEKELDVMFGVTGKDLGHDILKARINNAIHAKYPWTAKTIIAADREKGEREGVI